jgi:DNA-binding transcriptional regulator YiaG
MNTLPLELRIWRATYGLDQERAARHVGVHLNTWSRWERGVTEPDVTQLELVRELIAQPPPGWPRSGPERIGADGQADA